MDVVTFGSDRPPRRLDPRWWLAVAVAACVAVAVAAFAVDRGRDQTPLATPSSPPPSPSGGQIGAKPCAPVVTPETDAVAALVIDPDGLGLGRLLERRDEAALKGPWTVVVRRPGGSLGRNSAVVTFPADALPSGRRLDVGGVTGTAGDRMVVWPIAGAHARVRGDLSEAELLLIAAGTTVADGKPVVRPASGLNVVSTGPYRPPSIHEVRYTSSSLGEEAVLGDGLAYTGLAAGGGFEDQLHAKGSTAVGVVHCRPAIASTVFGGSGALAWEPLPGAVAFVAYSGSLMDASAIAALQRLAGRASVLNLREWQAARPDILDQTNEIG